MKYLKTNPHNNAGIGHMWMNWQLGAILAEKWGYGFVHSELNSKRSGGNWNDFLGFGEGYLKEVDVADYPKQKLPKWDYGFDESEETGRKNLKKLHDLVETGEDETVYEFPYSHFQGIVARNLPLIIPSLQKKYYKRHEDPTEKFTVSLHLRRGDVDPENNQNRWLKNEFYIDWIDRIKQVLDKSGIDSKFVLFSTTGRTGKFDDFQPLVERRIDGDPFEDFNYMVYSDILFAGLSSYSIMAAALNENFCFYCPLRTYTLWMEDNEQYSNAYDKSTENLERWIKQY